jgi:hypothetical protein
VLTPKAGFAVTHVGIIVRDMDKRIQYFEEFPHGVIAW